MKATAGSVAQRGAAALLALSAWATGCALGVTGCVAREPSASASAMLAAAALPPDAIVVLGHRPPLGPDGVALEYETQARVDAGVALYQRWRAARLLFSGGRSTPEVVEADVMASYAATRGVPEAALLRERASSDTIENARMSVRLLRRELGLQRRPRIVLVTSDYHVIRAAKLFRCAGADVEGVGVALRLSESERKKRLRSERWVRLYYRFIDECERAAQ